MHTRYMNTNRTAQVTVTLAAPVAGKVQIIVARDGQTVATKATKDGGNLMRRVDDFLRSVSVVRHGFTARDGVMVADAIVML
jgi:hypothetical protein